MIKSGFKVISKDLRSMLKEKHTLLKNILTAEAPEIERRAQAITPVETGALRESVQVRASGSPRYPGIIGTASAQNVRTGYNYARIQHENVMYHHAEPGQSKYLEEPMDEAVERIMRLL